MIIETYHDVPWLPESAYAEVWMSVDPVPLHLCTSSFVLAFDDHRRLLMSNVRKRGIDIPGGHIELGETPEQTAVRECLEETGAQVNIERKLGYLRLIVPNLPINYRYPAESFQVFFFGVIEGEMGPVQMPEECDAAVFMYPKELVEFARFRLHKQLIYMAERIMRERSYE